MRLAPRSPCDDHRAVSTASPWSPQEKRTVAPGTAKGAVFEIVLTVTSASDPSKVDVVKIVASR